MHAVVMLQTVLAAMCGAGGIGAVLTPALVHLTSRRIAVQTENTQLIEQLQEERNGVVGRLEQRDAMIAELWDYVYRLRYSIVKGDDPPTMPSTLTLAAVRAHIPAPAPAR
jgi:hypothetical protein